MKYTDEVPTVSGWYWVKRNGKQEIKLISKGSVNHWKVQRDNFMVHMMKQLELGETTEEVVKYSTNQPESFWQIEYYGPLVPPQ
jgi:hypothetical protein